MRYCRAAVEDGALKIAVSGKGGVGKTTVAAGLCLELAARGYELLAVDCDPDANLGGALGFPAEVLADVRPLSDWKELIAERTGADGGGLFKLNPYVADIPDAHCYHHGPFRLLVMEGAASGGAGCDCAQSSLMRRVVSEVVVRRDEAVVLDMEAGLEHLGRATARSVTAMLAVVEPGRRSLDSARRIFELAADLAIPRTLLVANRFRDAAELAELASAAGLPEAPVLGLLPEDAGIAAADRRGVGIEGHMGPATRRAFGRILDDLLEACRDV